MYQVIPLLVTGANPPVPTACFEYYLNALQWSPERPVHFTARCTSTDYISKYYWDWDDGQTSETEDSWTDHLYTQPGTYNVSLVARIGDVRSQPFTMPVALSTSGGTTVQELTPAQWNWSPKDMVVIGAKAFIAAGTSGLVVMDLSDPASPKMLANLALPGDACAIEVSGRYAYVACLSGGLQIVDIGNPASPRIASEYRLGETDVRGVKLLGNNAFLATGVSFEQQVRTPFNLGRGSEQPQPGGIIGLNISNPSAPRKVFEVPTTEFQIGPMALENNRLYYIDGGSLKTLALNGDNEPTSEASVTIQDVLFAQGQTLVVKDSYAYISGPLSGLVILHVDPPDDPANRKTIMVEMAFSLAFSGNRAFVGGSSQGIQVIDIADPNNPVIVGTVNAPNAVAIQIVDDYYLYAAHAGGVEVFNISDIQQMETPPAESQPLPPTGIIYPTGPGIRMEPVEPIGSSFTFGTPLRPLVNGNYLYVPDFTVGWHVIDISDPAAARMLGHVDLPGSQDVVIAGRYAYATGDPGLNVVDLADPANPTLAGSCEIRDMPKCIAYEDGVAFLLNRDGLNIVDVGDPQYPNLILKLGVSNDCRDLAIADGYAYIAAGEEGLKIVDVRIPERPRVVDTVDIRDTADHVWVNGNHVIATGQYRTLAVLEITSPGNLRTVKNVVTSTRLNDIVFADGTAYGAAEENGILILDLDPATGNGAAGVLNTPSPAQYFAVKDGYFFITSRDQGFHIVRAVQ
jgi:hypothetical protein